MISFVALGCLLVIVNINAFATVMILQLMFHQLTFHIQRINYFEVLKPCYLNIFKELCVLR